MAEGKMLVQIDEGLFEYYGIRIESITCVFGGNELKVYAEICAIEGNTIKSDVNIIVAFYTDYGIERTIDCYIQKENFFKCKIIRECLYFDDNNTLRLFEARISKIRAFIEKY